MRGPVAAVHGIVGFATCLCLIGFYAGADGLGKVNDVGNAVFGVLSLALAWLIRSPGRGLLLGVAGAGAVLTVVGTVLVMTDTTGFYLAGLWSSFGFALIGVWLVGAGRHGPAGPGRSGRVAGAIMMLGLVGVPGIAMGLDDMSTAPAWTFVAGVSWAGTYLLFPAWSLRLAGQKDGVRTGNKP